MDVPRIGCGLLEQRHYTVTRKATSAFERNTEAMTAQAKEDAAHFCAAQGKQLRVLDVVVDKPFYATGYASAKVVFKAVNPGEPLTSEPVRLRRTGILPRSR